MAESIILSAVDRMIGLLHEQDGYNVNLVRGAEKEIPALAKDLNIIIQLMDDAQNRVCDENINNWLSGLLRIAYELDNVLDEWTFAIRKLHISVVAPPNQKVCPFIPSSSCLSFKKQDVPRNIAKKILNVKAKFLEILNQYGFMINRQPTVESRPGPFVYLEEQVYGRDVDRDFLVSKLMDNGDELDIQVVSIVGMGGLGKTTLALLVYYHRSVEEYFDLKIWVCVSKFFDLAVIAEGVLGSIHRSSPNTNELGVLLENLQESINGKRFLLILDDVWTEDHNKWEPLVNSLRCGGAGSKILVTTRNVKVAKMMGSRDIDIFHLGLLSDDDCWLLFCCKALSGRNEVAFEDIGNKIAKQCNGLPITAMILGGLLCFRSSLEEWENVLNSKKWSMEEVKEHIYPSFLLSYNELSPTLQLCFSYCAVIPKDTKIIVENLIGNWMALGYLSSDNGNMELKGRECFDVLAMHSLFYDFEKDDFDEIISCKMHDMLHDFAQFLRKSGGVSKSTTCIACDPSQVSTVNVFYTLYCDEEAPPNLCECLISLRVLNFTNCGLKGIPHEIENLIHLRWVNLVGITKVSRGELKTIFKLYGLQTLGLRQCGIKEIPREIENLIQLRRLDLSGNESLKELPKEIGNLIELRRLDLSENESLKELPREIGNLIKLRRLDLSKNESLKELPREIGNLIQLRRLDLSKNESLKELPREIGNLIQLRRLDLSENKSLKELPKEIGNLINLRGLNLDGNKSLEVSTEIISGLRELQTTLGCRSDCRLYARVKCMGSNTWSKLTSLENFNDIDDILWLKIRFDGNFNLAEMVEDACAAELRNKTHIEEFRIYVEESSTSISKESVNVIEALQPHPNLEELSIWNYGGSTLPLWILSPLNQLRNLKLHFCNHLSSLPPLGKLPCLETICIDLMESLQIVGREFLGITTGDVAVFPKLKKLEFQDCEEWAEWEDITAEEEAASLVMPCLTDLTITCCNSLTVLPNRLLRKASSLEKLRISGSTKLVKRYENQDGSDWKSISINNPGLQLVCFF